MVINSLLYLLVCSQAVNSIIMYCGLYSHSADHSGSSLSAEVQLSIMDGII